MTTLQHISPALVRKYNQSLPRYTSYPTVPVWKDRIDPEHWTAVFADRFRAYNHTEGIDLYVHLPFCETLCTYCGCNKKITRNHNVEEEYLSYLKKEWQQYRSVMDGPPVIRRIHLGGGTPTFFSPRNLEKLVAFLLKDSVVHPRHEFSIEGHPNNTTSAHLTVLHSLGFRRISYGVQDMDPEVQRVINRIQPFENVERATLAAREAGFESVNFDLIYGLPLQTLQGITNTVWQVISLRPDRIAFYSYAHVPWTSRAQRLFSEADLPQDEEKIALYLRGGALLLQNGYADIGMDHFALPKDELVAAKEEGTLDRNFMGYTTRGSGMLLGLGVSAISDTGTAFAQNEKALHDYYTRIGNTGMAVRRGYFLSIRDRIFRRYINDIACRGYTRFRPEDRAVLESVCFPALQPLARDGIVTYDATGLRLTALGHYFIRNVCSAFDLYLQRQGSPAQRPVFSKSV